MPSLNAPTALYCWEPPAVIVLVTGVTPMLVSIALETVNVVVPVIPANTAVIVEVPAPTPVARPWRPAALLMVATDGVADAQVALAVSPMFWVLGSPVAASGRATPI